MSGKIDTLADEYWAYFLEVEPDPRAHHWRLQRCWRFEETTREAEDRQLAAMREFARRAEEIDVSDLDEQQRVTRAVLSSDATTRADVLAARLTELAADPIFGAQVSMPIMMGMLALPDADVAEALVEKFRGLGRYYRELADRQREGVASGRVSAAFAVADTVEQLDGLLSTPVADDPLLTTTPPPSGMDVDGWKARLRAVVESDVRPGMAVYRDVLRDEVLALGRPDDKCGLGWLPDGDDAYAATLRNYTTTTKTAQEIHDIGLAQIEKLADEYRALGPEVVGTDDLRRRSSRRCAPTRSCTSRPARSWSRPLRSRCSVRGTPCRSGSRSLPQAPCAVQPTDHWRQGVLLPARWRRQPAAARSSSTPPTRRHGAPSSCESMAFHEGIPGHHLQLAIASELSDVPEFRKHIHNSAYAEGWGLYTERLSDEMGLYSSAVDRMGMFAADSMRACRLVVDTGLHALGWSRQQAVEFMVTNSPLADAMCPAGDRPLHRQPGPGHVVHGGSPGDPADACRGRAATGECLRRQEVPLGRARLRIAAAGRPRRGGPQPPGLTRWCISTKRRGGPWVCLVRTPGAPLSCPWLTCCQGPVRCDRGGRFVSAGPGYGARRERSVLGRTTWLRRSR